MAEEATPTRNTARRDLLVDLQHRAQKKWAEEKTFEVDAPEMRDGVEVEKFFGNLLEKKRFSFMQKLF